jgi:hypothetical protein
MQNGGSGTDMSSRALLPCVEMKCSAQDSVELEQFCTSAVQQQRAAQQQRVAQRPGTRRALPSGPPAKVARFGDGVVVPFRALSSAVWWEPSVVRVGGRPRSVWASAMCHCMAGLGTLRLPSPPQSLGPCRTLLWRRRSLRAQWGAQSPPERNRKTRRGLGCTGSDLKTRIRGALQAYHPGLCESG